MRALRDLDLIRAFNVYLLVTFVIATARSVRVYLDIVRLVVAFPNRWPNLLRLVREHRGVVLTRSLFLPAALALGLFVLQWTASTIVWPTATVTPALLLERPIALAVCVLLATAVVAVDLVGVAQAARRFDRAAVEPQLDRAEYWLASKTAHVVRIATFGLVNPRKKVATELQAALRAVGASLSARLWLVSVDVAVNLAFGLAIWTTWASRG